MGNCCFGKNRDMDGDMVSGREIQEDEMDAKRCVRYKVHYPPHEKRKETCLYRKTHKYLCDEKKLSCFVCGKRRDDLGGESLETHHFYVEKAAENGIDWDKFSEFAVRGYNIQTGESLSEGMDWLDVKKNPYLFVDSRNNMVVLCKEHHTSSRRGIHHVPFPDWILQKYPKDGFTFLE
jgi:hypothetical protein